MCACVRVLGGIAGTTSPAGSTRTSSSRQVRLLYSCPLHLSVQPCSLHDGVKFGMKICKRNLWMFSKLKRKGKIFPCIVLGGIQRGLVSLSAFRRLFVWQIRSVRRSHVSMVLERRFGVLALAWCWSVGFGGLLASANPVMRASAQGSFVLSPSPLNPPFL